MADTEAARRTLKSCTTCQAVSKEPMAATQPRRYREVVSPIAAMLVVVVVFGGAPAAAAEPSTCGIACAPAAAQPPAGSTSLPVERSVTGAALTTCSTAPMTGYYRTGRCSTGPEDTGTHVVCAKVTSAFLEYSLSKGNDLVTPRPEFTFPGLKPGDRWCLCALRWREAVDAHVAPPVVFEATHEAALRFAPRKMLEAARSNETR